jgi:hypothetical protein
VTRPEGSAPSWRRGNYVLNRTAVGYPLKNVQNGRPVAVAKDHWTRLDGLNEDDCPDSGIYGAYSAPCWGQGTRGQL